MPLRILELAFMLLFAAVVGAPGAYLAGLAVLENTYSNFLSALAAASYGALVGWIVAEEWIERREAWAV